MKVIVTAFESFGGESQNPSALALTALFQQAAPPGVLWQQHILPVSFARSQQLLWQLLHEEKPDLLLCVGQAGGRAQLSLEQVAINLIEARIPDNDGAQPNGVAVVPHAPAAYFSPLPLKAMRAALHRTQIPCEISYSAGTYVCNATLYSALHYIAQHQLPCRAGFIHIPFAPAQVCDKPNVPSMSIETVASALWQLIDVAQHQLTDISATVGALD